MSNANGFIELCFDPLAPADENMEIITAFLADFPLNTFEIREEKLYAYADEKDWNELLTDEVKEAVKDYANAVSVNYIERENWNKIWEQNYFEPVNVADVFGIRAAFHEAQKNVEFDLVIQPKMSFGTGHHQTTKLMLELMLKSRNTFANANVLDMGAGTGILAIAAEKMGASHCDAVDIESWAAENIVENANENHCRNIHAFCNDVSFLKENNGNYDIILANIQRSVLLEDGATYIRHLNAGGLLFVSGFYIQDLQDIQAYFESHSCELMHDQNLDNWCAAGFRKG